MIRTGERQLPPSDRSEHSDVDSLRQGRSDPDEPKAWDDVLRLQCMNFVEERNLVYDHVAKSAGTNPTALSKWINCKPVGDVDKLERHMRAWLKRESSRSDPTINIFFSEMCERLKKVFDLISRTSNIAVVVAESGEGKTCAVQHYWTDPENPLTVVVDCFRWSNTPRGVRGEIWSQTSTAAWNASKGGSQDKFLINHYRRAKCLIIFDKAENLTWTALDWIMDFHEATTCPIALVGDDEFLARLKEKPRYRRHFVKVAYVNQVRAKDRQKFASQILQDMLPDNGESQALGDLGRAILDGPGAGHALRNRITLVREAMRNGKPALETMQSLHELSPQAHLRNRKQLTGGGR